MGTDSAVLCTFMETDGLIEDIMTDKYLSVHSFAAVIIWTLNYSSDRRLANVNMPAQSQMRRLIALQSGNNPSDLKQEAVTAFYIPEGELWSGSPTLMQPGADGFSVSFTQLDVSWHTRVEDDSPSNRTAPLLINPPCGSLLLRLYADWKGSDFTAHIWASPWPWGDFFIEAYGFFAACVLTVSSCHRI